MTGRGQVVGYGPAVRGSVVLRVGLFAVVLAAATVGALLLVGLAFVLWTGCVLECSPANGNRPGAVALGLGAVACVPVGSWACRRTWRAGPAGTRAAAWALGAVASGWAGFGVVATAAAAYADSCMADGGSYSACQPPDAAWAAAWAAAAVSGAWPSVLAVRAWRAR